MKRLICANLFSLALVHTCLSVEPPKFVLGQNDERFLSAGAGMIYFTSDGSDPRLESGKPSPTAKIAESPAIHETTILAESASCRAQVPENGADDERWHQFGFDDSAWAQATPPIGYDDEDTYIPLIKHDVKAAMRGKRGSIRLRWEFYLTQIPDADEWYLDVQCDDGFVAFLNGQRMASMNAPGSLSWRSEAEDKVNDSGAVEFRAMRLSEGAKGFAKGRNVLAVQALNDGLTSSDFLFAARLRARSVTGGTVVWDPAKPTSLVARTYHDGEWSEAIRVQPPQHLTKPHDGKSWAQFLGPNGNAIYSGPPIATEWPDDGPRIAWKHDVGAGHASPVVADGKVIVIHRNGRNFVIDCLDATTGKPLWSKPYPTDFKDKTGYDHGSRGTPTIAGDRVVFSLPDGMLGCLSMADGRELWKYQLFETFETRATWHGFLTSPLVVEDKVIYNVGDGNNQSGVVAFALKGGKPQWTASRDEACGVSPMLVRLDGDVRALVTTRTHVRCLNPASGEEVWAFPTPGQSSGNPLAATPVIYGDEILLSGWYGIGLNRVRITNGTPSLVWNLENLISSHYATPICHEGHLYGYHGHALNGPTLRCVRLATREVVWEEDHGGAGTLIRMGDDLLIMSDQGEIMLVAAKPDKCTIKHRAQITRRATRNYPAIANGYVYVKGPRKLVCLDFRPAH